MTTPMIYVRWATTSSIPPTSTPTQTKHGKPVCEPISLNCWAATLSPCYPAGKNPKALIWNYTLRIALASKS